MPGQFILWFGVLVFLLHIPGLIVPERHRQLGQAFVAKEMNLRLIGLPMIGIAIVAFLVSPPSGAARWGFWVLALYMAASGIFLIAAPGKFAARSEALFSGPIRLWKARAISKCVLALALVAWGFVLVSR